MAYRLYLLVLDHVSALSSFCAIMVLDLEEAIRSTPLKLLGQVYMTPFGAKTPPSNFANPWHDSGSLYVVTTGSSLELAVSILRMVSAARGMA
mmetsp:Transcript_4426/g.8159  ORF Transcript_4426/g.8159 Transcript_4426/m.8159 type:complete len:93 (+) Transcript_4426:749-1027(+)